MAPVRLLVIDNRDLLEAVGRFSVAKESEAKAKGVLEAVALAVRQGDWP